MHYYCKKCGAVVDGKFCSCCGTRATSSLQDFRKIEKARKNEFERWCRRTESRFDGIQAMHIANACWCAVDRINAGTVDNFNPTAYIQLSAHEEEAKRVFAELVRAL